MPECISRLTEGGKGGASANPERAVDPSRLDLRIGKIVSAKKVRLAHVNWCKDLVITVRPLL